MLINIEGTDGSGKGTQTKLLARRLRKEGYSVNTIGFPRHGHHAAWMVDRYLLGAYGSLKEVGPFAGSLLYALDRFDASFQIKKWLARGDVVIADRYPVSNLAHQGSHITSSKERKRFWKWNLELEHNLLSLPKPDAVIILHMPYTIAYQLVGQKKTRGYLKGARRDLTERDREHLKKTEQVYLELARFLPGTKLIECAPKNNLLSKTEIHEKIWTIVRKLLAS